MGITFFITYLIFYIFRIWNGLTLSQLNRPLILRKTQDAGIWLFQHIPLYKLAQNPQSVLLLDTGLVLLAILLLALFIQRKDKFWLLAIFAVFSYLYVIISMSFPNVPIRKYLGLILIPFIFLTRGKRFLVYTELMRYFVCFIFASAALWKISRGALLQKDQFVNILIKQNQDYYLQVEPNLFQSISRWLILHPELTNSLFAFTVLLQLSFGLGFLTKRFDRLLFIFLVAFLVADYFIMTIDYWELLVFTPFFFLPQLYKRFKIEF